jgi:PAS domain S-box-containing protein
VEGRLKRGISAVLESLPDGFIALDPDGGCEYANQEAQRILGRSREEILAASGAALFAEAAPELAATVAQAADEQVTVDREFYDQRTDRWIEIRACPAPEGGTSIYLRDVSARRRAEEELRRSQRELLDFFENATEGLHWVGPDGTILWANQAELDLLGYTPEEYLGRSITEFHADREVIDRLLSRLKGGDRVHNYEARLRCKDGSIRHVLINSSVLRYEGQFIHTRCFTRDITDRKLAEDALRQQAAALQEADRRKDEFLAMLAHELRNPLAPIITAAEIFRLRVPDDPLLQKQREVVDRQVKLMKRLLDDLLDVSRITRGKVELAKVRLDLATVLAQAVEMSRPEIDERQHTLHVSLPDAPLGVEGDPVRLAQVFTNLLNNAAKYSPPGGAIWLVAESYGDYVRVCVKDTGVGMTPEVLARAFELFAQGERGLDRSQGGLGIGLTLVKELVELHGGSVTASSAGIDQGSEFTVTLPRIAEAPRE